MFTGFICTQQTLFGCCSSETGVIVGKDSYNAVRDTSSGGSGLASAMLEVATELAHNCSVPGVSEAATLMSVLVKLVSDSRENATGMEKSLKRCRSIFKLLEDAAMLFGKVRNFLCYLRLKAKKSMEMCV